MSGMDDYISKPIDSAQSAGADRPGRRGRRRRTAGRRRHTAPRGARAGAGVVRRGVVHRARRGRRRARAGDGDAVHSGRDPADRCFARRYRPAMPSASGRKRTRSRVRPEISARRAHLRPPRPRDDGPGPTACCGSKAVLASLEDRLNSSKPSACSRRRLRARPDRRV